MISYKRKGDVGDMAMKWALPGLGAVNRNGLSDPSNTFLIP